MSFRGRLWANYEQVCRVVVVVIAFSWMIFVTIMATMHKADITNRIERLVHEAKSLHREARERDQQIIANQGKLIEGHKIIIDHLIKLKDD